VCFILILIIFAACFSICRLFTGNHCFRSQEKVYPNTLDSTCPKHWRSRLQHKCTHMYNIIYSWSKSRVDTASCWSPLSSALVGKPHPKGGTCNFSCSEKYAKLKTIRVPACGMFSDPNVYFIVISKLIKHGPAKKDLSWRLVSSLKNA